MINQKLQNTIFKYYHLRGYRIKKDLVKIWGLEGEEIFEGIKKNKIYYERQLLRHLNHSIKNNKGISIDIGANIGNHSIFFAKYISDKVISFEPSLVNYNILLRNLKTNLKNNQFLAFQIGLGCSEYDTNLFYPSKNNFGMAKIRADDKSKNTEKIKIDTLDNIVKKNKINDPINLIKIDVEGMEIDVLKGSELIITKNLPHLVIEAHNEIILSQVNSFLKPYKYQVLGKFCSTPTYHFIIPEKHIIDKKPIDILLDQCVYFLNKF